MELDMNAINVAMNTHLNIDPNAITPLPAQPEVSPTSGQFPHDYGGLQIGALAAARETNQQQGDHDYGQIGAMSAAKETNHMRQGTTQSEGKFRSQHNRNGPSEDMYGPPLEMENINSESGTTNGNGTPRGHGTPNMPKFGISNTNGSNAPSTLKLYDNPTSGSTATVSEHDDLGSALPSKGQIPEFQPTATDDGEV